MIDKSTILANIEIMQTTIEKINLRNLIFLSIFVLLFNSSYAFIFHNKNKLYFGQNKNNTSYRYL